MEDVGGEGFVKFKRTIQTLGVVPIMGFGLSYMRELGQRRDGHPMGDTGNLNQP